VTSTSPSSRLLIGTHTYAAEGNALRRQSAGVASLLALHGVEIVNVQFAQGAHHVPGLRRLDVLGRASTDIDPSGPRKPIVSEIFDRLAAEASARGSEYICFTNADIIVSQQAVDWILDGGTDGCLLSREDFDGATGAATGMQLGGIDTMAIRTRWWTRNRWRFRPYIVGETVWDNVYAAILMGHGNGAIENRRPFIRHEMHDARRGAAFTEYTRLLSALDAFYFTRWCCYWWPLMKLREQGATAEEEAVLARSVFSRQKSVAESVIQAGRSAKARVRYAWWHLTRGNTSAQGRNRSGAGE
jgi:hypothetical protein